VRVENGIMQKKLLLSSTALVGAFALATPALADIEVTLSGQVEFGASIADEETLDDGRGYFFFMDSETKIEAEGASDNGINYAAKVELETDADGDGGDVNADEARLAFWGGFGRVELGREDGAADNMFLGGEDFQAGTGGIDGDAGNLNINGVEDSGDAAKITYFTPRVAGFQLGVSFTPDTGDDESDSDDDEGEIEDQVDFGVNFTTSAAGADVTLAAVGSFGEEEDDGDDTNDEGDLEDYGIGVGLEFAGLGIGAGYTAREDLDEGDQVTVGAKYGFGPASVSVGYSHDSPDEGSSSDVLVFSGDYGVFPGVTLKGDLAFNSDDDDADGDSTSAGIITVQIDY